MKYERVFAEVFRKPWAMLPEKLQVIAQLVSLRAAGGKLTEAEIRARLDEAAISAGPRSQQSYGAVAVIPIRGVISHRANLMSQFSGGTSVEKLTAQFRQALADSTIKAIVFDVDSPGGSVDGVPELAEEIYKSRGQKKSISVANGTAASAAYWLAASAGETVVIPSGQVGSIGVFAAHEDLSKALEAEGVKVSLISAGKYKTDGSPYEPLSDSARADLQAKVDAFYGMFVKSVARGRRVSQDDVRGGFGQGRMVLAAQAVKEGMADRVATMDDVLARLGASDSNQPRIAAELPIRPKADEHDDPLDENDCVCGCHACSNVGSGNCAMCADTMCNDTACAAAGCPNQSRAPGAEQVDPKIELDRRRRELDLL
jgi:signal peptide peptidase SppA